MGRSVDNTIDAFNDNSVDTDDMPFLVDSLSSIAPDQRAAGTARKLVVIGLRICRNLHQSNAATPSRMPVISRFTAYRQAGTSSAVGRPCWTIAMTRRTESSKQPPQFELRWGGLHLTIQRVPAWLVGLVTTAVGTGAAWWTSR
ncbi:hypothetical protein ACWC2K_14875 [Streptomyces chattanoogensis]